MKRAFIAPVIVISLLCRAAGVLAGQGATPLSTTVFDGLITKEFIAANTTSAVPFVFSLLEKGDRKVYIADYQVSHRDTRNYYFCTITVAGAGKLLDPKVYREAYARERKEKADRGEKYFAVTFPVIGKRAWRRIDGFGPGGGGYSLTFTTADNRYDVSVSLSMRLSDEHDEPEVDIHQLAKRIADLYDETIADGSAKEKS